MFEKSVYHTNPEEALNIGKDLNSKKTYWHALGNCCFVSRTNYGTTG
jgi:hypothetical protein